MSNFIADDAAAIAVRLKELEKERAGATKSPEPEKPAAIPPDVLDLLTFGT